MSARILAMTRRFIVTLSICLLGAAPAAWAQTSEGTEFWLGFPHNGGSQQAELALGISSRDGATVTVTATAGKSSTAPTFTETFTLAPNGSRLVVLPAALMLDKNMNHLVDRASIHVVATAPVAVHARNWADFSSDSYLALPISGLGKEYTLLSWTSSGGTESKVVATQDNTSVTFFAQRPARAGDNSAIPAGGSRSVLLQRGETTLFQSSGIGADMTGSRIVADKPVAVMAGNSCANVPDTSTACDHLLEQVPPVASLGQRFLLVPALRDIVGDMVRVVGVADDTAVYLGGSLHRTLSRGEFYEFLVDSPVELKSSRPVLVGQFLRGSLVSGNSGDPSFTIVVPTAQFMSSYLVAATFAGDPSSTRYTRNYLTVVIPTGAVSTLRLDGVAVPDTFSPIPGTSFSWAALSVGATPHRLEAAIPFGLHAHGIRNFESYAFAAGTDLRTIYDASDPFAPNARMVQVGSELRGLATDSSDTNANGLLDPDETVWGGTIGPRSEDTNMNNVLDAGEDRNGNGLIDRDLGLRSVELAPGSSNLVMDVTPFNLGDGAAQFVVRRIDATRDGLGTVIVMDFAGNATTYPVGLVNSTTISQVRVREIVSREKIEVDFASFGTQPSQVLQFPDRYEIEWFYPVASTLSEIDLSYDVTVKEALAGESRVVSRELSLEYQDSAGNPVRYVIGPKAVEVLKSTLDFSASLDKAEYMIGENATLRIEVKNLGTLQASNALCLRMLDQDGRDTFTQVNFSSGFVAVGATAVVLRPLALSSYFIGQYTVKLEAYLNGCNSGAVVKSIVLPLTIVDQAGEVALDSGLSLDRAFYESTDRVLIDTVVRNLHLQRLAEGYSVHVQVIRPDGTSLAPQSRAVPALVPRNEWRASFPFTLANEPAGIYTALLQVRDMNGGIVQTRTTAFEVRSATTTGFGLTGSLAASPASVPIGESIRFDYSLQNQGNAAYTGLPLTLRVVNPATGALVAEIALTDSVALGATKTGSVTWTASGVEGTLLIAALSATVGGREIALGQVNFTLLASQVRLTGTLTAAPKTLPVGGSVSFAYRVDNAGTRAYTALPATLRITKQGAIPVAELPLTLDIAAGGSASGNLAWTTLGAPGDVLTAQLVAVVAGVDYNLGQDTFNLVAPDTGQYFAGTVAANVEEATIGEPVSLTFTVRNDGTSAYSGIPVTVRVVNSTRGTTAAEFTQSYDLLAGASQSGNHSWVAAGTAGDNMVARLIVTFAGTPIVLAEDAFTLKGQPLQLTFTQAVERASRVLALAACGEPSSASSCDPSRANALRSLLQGLGVMHFVTTDAAVFRTELRSGEYTTYWISGRVDKLDDGLAQEVREAAHRGEAVILDGVHDERNKVLDAVGGVDVQGKLGEQNQTVLLSAPVFGDKLLATVGRGLKIELAGGHVLGRFGGPTGVPAVVGNTYGRGRALFLGLDLVASLAAEVSWPGQVDLGLGWVLPQLSTTYTPGAYVPVVMTVTNAGAEATVEVRTTLPAGASFIAADPTAVSTTNPIVWRFTLAAGAEQTLHLALSAPVVAGSYSLSTEIGTLLGGVYAPYLTSQALSLTVVSASAGLPVVQSEILALVVATNERADQDKAAADVAAAHVAITAGQWNVAIDRLISSIDWLVRITSIDVSAQRQALDAALKEAQWQWAESR